MKKPFLLLFFLSSIPWLLTGQIYNDYIGFGHNEGVIISSSNQQSDGQNAVNGSGAGKDLLGASRFLSHATLGAPIEEILRVDSIGYEAWIDEQMSLPTTSYLGTVDAIDEILYEYYIDLGQDPEQYEVNVQHFRFAWSHIMQTAPDVLRHRIALALSEILVISTDSDLNLRGEGVASYYDILSEHAFGNYYDLLMDVTLHPTMGFYLSHLNNPRSNPAANLHPDENYAREIMQLFTIGLYELNQDGSRQLDNQGNFIPTYDQDDIRELAKVFTGLGMADWHYEDITDPPSFGIPVYLIDLTQPMEMYPFYHEPGDKTIVGDFTIPAGQTGMEDIEMAVEHLFNHQNVGPFISSLLIKRLVKSNPTPEYIERVANVFNDNGSGVRGDLGAVIKAILLDEEARDCGMINHPTNGRLKEPIQRYTQYVKALRSNSPSGWFWHQGFAFDIFTDQFPMHAPTVFNFFLPDYQPNSLLANEGLTAPEFQIFNSTTSVGYFNYMYYMTVAQFNNEVPEAEFSTLGVLEDYQAIPFVPELDALSTYPEAVVDYMDLVLAHGNMAEETRDIIVGSTDPLVPLPEYLKAMALYLTMISPDFVIMK